MKHLFTSPVSKRWTLLAIAIVLGLAIACATSRPPVETYDVQAQFEYLMAQSQFAAAQYGVSASDFQNLNIVELRDKYGEAAYNAILGIQPGTGVSQAEIDRIQQNPHYHVQNPPQSTQVVSQSTAGSNAQVIARLGTQESSAVGDQTGSGAGTGTSANTDAGTAGTPSSSDTQQTGDSLSNFLQKKSILEQFPNWMVIAAIVASVSCCSCVVLVLVLAIR